MGECWNMEGAERSLWRRRAPGPSAGSLPGRWAGAVQGVGQGAGREPAPGDFDTGEWKAGAVQDSEPVHAGTGGLLAGNGREYCAGISLYRTIRRRGAVEARAGSGAAVQGSSAPGASPGADRLLQRAGGEARLLAAPFPIKRNFRCRCCSVWPRWRNGRGGAGWCGALTGRGTRWSRRIAGTGRDILGGKTGPTARRRKRLCPF